MSSEDQNPMNLSLDEIIRNQRQTNKRRGGAVLTNRRFRGGATARPSRGAKVATRGGPVTRVGGLRSSAPKNVTRRQGGGRVTNTNSHLLRAKAALQRARMNFQAAQRQTAAQSAQRRRNETREATLMQRRGLTTTPPIYNRLSSQPRGRGRRGRRGGFLSASPKPATFARNTLSTIQRRGGGLYTMSYSQMGSGDRRMLAMDLEAKRLEMRQNRQLRKGNFGRGRGGSTWSRGARRSPASLQVRIPNSYYTREQSSSRDRGRGRNSQSSRQSLLQEARAIVRALSQTSSNRHQYM